MNIFKSFISFEFWFVFLLSLNSFYFYDLGLALFSVLGALLSSLYILLNLNKIHLFINRGALLVCGLMFVFSLFTLLFNQEFFLAKRIPLFLLIIPIILCTNFFFCHKKKQIKDALKLSIYIHVFFLILQLLVYIFSGTFIDFLEPITGEAQRALGGSYFIGSYRLIRVTGLFNEPGTYSTYVFFLLVLYDSISRNKKIENFQIIVILSILITFSTYGFIFSFIYLFKYLIKMKIFYKVLLSLIMAPFVYLALLFYFIPRFTNENIESGVDFREVGVKFIFDKIIEDPVHFLFGYSFFIDLNSVFLLNDFPFNDLGLIFNIIIQFGFLGTFMFILISKASLLKSNKNLIFAIVFCKLSISTLFLWIPLTKLFIKDENQKR